MTAIYVAGCPICVHKQLGILALASVLSILGLPTPSHGQTSTESLSLYEETRQHKRLLLDKIGDVTAAGTARVDAIQSLLDARSRPPLYSLSLGQAGAQAAGNAALSSESLRREVEMVRVDKELGGGASASGGTSLVEKGGIPKVLSFAVENGALTRAQSGTTITFKGNPAGIVKALNASAARFESVFGDTQLLPPVTGYLTRFAFGLSFDADRNLLEQTPTFTGDKQQLSAVSAKYEIFNRRDPGNGHYQRRLVELFSGRQSSDNMSDMDTALMGSEETLVRFLTRGSGGPAFDAWRERAATALAEEPTMEVLDAEVAALATILFSMPDADEIRDQLVQYRRTYGQLLQTRDAMLNIAGKGAILSAEYVQERAVGQPSLSTMRIIYEVGLGDGKIDLTANASATLFHPHESLPVDVGRVRDWSLSSQVDVPVGSITRGRNLVFTVAGRFEWLLATPALMVRGRDVAVLDGAVGGIAMPVMYSSMNSMIAVAQAKLTIPVKGTGVKIPISFTVANRSDLIQERTVRGQVGMTLNLDSFFGD